MKTASVTTLGAQRTKPRHWEAACRAGTQTSKGASLRGQRQLEPAHAQGQHWSITGGDRARGAAKKWVPSPSCQAGSLWSPLLASLPRNPWQGIHLIGRVSEHHRTVQESRLGAERQQLNEQKTRVKSLTQ